ncbi:hypothetical protein I302_108548 [Kwoniella bestiolae CBS 10118]|uniref:BRCT domain-containing protein n=1 Tax=Kwoniella bestiolae CBS 10118 TaxID=1296100 RepID=A0A1B9FVD7_9TREE|nr:hypothetical protein I302_07079 [Kwoniella bestiolae CBS 10118]OCF22739.1 hypothetical protein I302_07079 [Kwoniella bestiolae CBS 10118]
MTIFFGQSFWIVGFEEERRLEMEQTIRTHGGRVSPFIQLATRTIFLRPVAPSDKGRIGETFKSLEEANEMNKLSGNCISLAEYWIGRCIEDGRMVELERYLVKREDLFNLAIWEEISGDEVNNQDRPGPSASTPLIAQKVGQTDDRAPSGRGIHGLGVKEEEADDDETVPVAQQHQPLEILPPDSESASDTCLSPPPSPVYIDEEEEGMEEDLVTSSAADKNRARKLQRSLYQKRYFNRQTISPEDIPALNALIEDLRDKVKNGFPGGGGLEKYLRGRRLLTLYGKYRPFIRQQVPELTSRKSIVGQGNGQESGAQIAEYINMSASLFSGQSFWMVGYDEDEKVDKEQLIRDHGGIISPAIQLATSIIFLQPVHTNFDHPFIASAFDSLLMSEKMDALSGNCLALSEYWVRHSILHDGMREVEEYLVKKEDLFNMAFWGRFGDENVEAENSVPPRENVGIKIKEERKTLNSLDSVHSEKNGQKEKKQRTVVDPADEQVLEALISDLKRKVKSGFPPGKGMTQYIKEQKVYPHPRASTRFTSRWNQVPGEDRG